jgi:hypothetical protein
MSPVCFRCDVSDKSPCVFLHRDLHFVRVDGGSWPSFDVPRQGSVFFAATAARDSGLRSNGLSQRNSPRHAEAKNDLFMTGQVKGLFDGSS